MLRRNAYVSWHQEQEIVVNKKAKETIANKRKIGEMNDI